MGNFEENASGDSGNSPRETVCTATQQPGSNSQPIFLNTRETRVCWELVIRLAVSK